MFGMVGCQRWMKVVTRLCWKKSAEDTRAGINGRGITQLWWLRTIGWFVCVMNGMNDCRTEECMEAAAFLAVINASSPRNCVLCPATPLQRRRVISETVVSEGLM